MVRIVGYLDELDSEELVDFFIYGLLSFVCKAHLLLLD